MFCTVNCRRIGWEWTSAAEFANGRHVAFSWAYLFVRQFVEYFSLLAFGTVLNER
jgi:hypothetical protein